METNKTIYDFESPATFFCHLKHHFPGKQKALTLERFSSLLGYQSPRTVAMVMKNQRLPSQQMIERLAESAALPEDQINFLLLLVKKVRLKKAGSDTAKIEKQIAVVRKKHKKQMKLSATAEAYIRHWYHGVIYNLIDTGDFIEDYAWISQRLAGKVSPNTVKDAINRLLTLGLVTRDQKSNKLISTDVTLIGQSDIPSQAIRDSHSQFLERAKEALDEESVLDRQFVSICLKGDPADIQEAKKMIRDFYNKFCKRFWSDNGTEIYRLNIQYFKHTVQVR